MERVIKQFPILEAELCARYMGVTTPMVNDVLRAMGKLSQTLPETIMPLKDEMKVAGIAFCISGEKSTEQEGEMEERAKMLEAIGKDTVCVWATGGDNSAAQWGEIMTMAAKSRGCRGAMVDGGVRDTSRVLEQGFPVFCRYRSSSGMLGRFRLTGYQKPVTIGKVTICPGDVMLGDIDGCICIPRDIAYEVLVEAEKIRDNEVEIKKMVDGGMKPSEVVQNGGYF